MTTLSSIYQEIKLAYIQENWPRIKVLSQKNIVRKPTRPNLEILRIILKSFAKSSTKSKKLPPRHIKPSTFTFQRQTTDVLLLMAKNMKIEDVLSLCETNKAFNKGICKNDNFWIQRLERDFGSIKKEGKRNYFQEYVIKYKLRRQKILSEYKEYPGLEERINRWLKDTSKILHISNLGLKEWPEALKGKEHLIVILRCSQNLLTFLPALPNCVELDCGDNLLTSLPALLKCVELDCSNNQLITLTPSGSTSLSALLLCVKLDCYGNLLTFLPLLPKCVKLDCYGNLLTFLPALPNCVELDCDNNQLTSLPALPNCVELHCRLNKLVTLTRSGSTTLPALLKCVHLYCGDNQLTSLPALLKCVKLWCDDNQLISLPALLKCVELNCSINQLTSLPALLKCVHLYCGGNQLTFLPVLLKCVELYCRDNQLTSLPALLKCVELYCENNQLTFLPALLSIQSRDDLNASNNPFPPGYTHRLL